MTPGAVKEYNRLHAEANRLRDKAEATREAHKRRAAAQAQRDKDEVDAIVRHAQRLEDSAEALARGER